MTAHTATRILGRALFAYYMTLSVAILTGSVTLGLLMLATEFV